MPQLKKLSVLPSSILPKIEIGLEGVFSTYTGAQQDTHISSYLPLFADVKSPHLLSSDAESDGADSIPSKPRKRQRLDHLSQEEKIMRRKMKNRVAAQTARDRKKARMAELEDQVLELETERKMLVLANMELQRKNSTLQKENEELKLRLGESCLNDVKVKNELSRVTEESTTSVKETESRLSDNSGSFEHAEGTGSTNSYSLDDAIRLLTTNSETDALLDLLQQCSEDLLECEDLSSCLPEYSETRENETPSTEVVGTTPKCLEPHKELIHFDHIYYKQDEDLSGPTDPNLSMPESDLSTKDSCMDIPTQLDAESIVEVVNSSEIPVICISESPDSVSTDHILQFDENFCYPEFGDQIQTTKDIKPLPSPVSSDGGYDSSFSVSSPSSSVVNSWDETLTELFPTLV